jgi:osmoprotectant transport system ATP-binding protein
MTWLASSIAWRARTYPRHGVPGCGKIRPDVTETEAGATGGAGHGAATLEFREATKRYPGQEAPALDALSLEVPAGEICVLVGPSGCGKTTAMRMVNRMIDITDGDILLDGRSVRERRPAALRREIGYAIQQIGLFPHLTIGDNIATVPKLLGWSADRIRDRVDELLELVSLDPAETRDRYPAQLSGGQRQRVGVARALAVDPPLMLMDEPFGAIDPINRERLQNEFLRLQQEIRKTIVFVTHDIDEAIKMGDKIAILQQGGKLAQYAPPAELLMYPANRFVEDFVGADRALKRLALQRVRDIDLWTVARVQVGEPVAQIKAKIAEADIPIPLLVDDEDRPVGWLGKAGMAGERVREELRSPAEPSIEMDDVLRDALADLLVAETRYAPVVDARGRVAGVLSLEIIGHFLQEAPSESRTGADLVEEIG